MNQKTQTNQWKKKKQPKPHKQTKPENQWNKNSTKKLLNKNSGSFSQSPDPQKSNKEQVCLSGP